MITLNADGTGKDATASPALIGRVSSSSAIANRTSPGTVVQQAFTVDHRPERPIGGQPLEGRDDGRRVGGGDHRADDEGELDRQAGGHRKDDRHDHGADHDPRERQQGEAAPPPPELGDAEPVAGLEDQAGQEHDEHEIRVDDDRRHAREAGHGADEQARDDESDGVRDAKRARHDRHDRGEDEQADEQLDGVRKRLVVHRASGQARTTAGDWSASPVIDV